MRTVNGIRNIGNSCYLNSLLQSLYSLDCILNGSKFAKLLDDIIKIIDTKDNEQKIKEQNDKNKKVKEIREFGGIEDGGQHDPIVEYFDAALPNFKNKQLADVKCAYNDDDHCYKVDDMIKNHITKPNETEKVKKVVNGKLKEEIQSKYSLRDAITEIIVNTNKVEDDREYYFQRFIDIYYYVGDDIVHGAADNLKHYKKYGMFDDTPFMNFYSICKTKAEEEGKYQYGVNYYIDYSEYLSGKLEMIYANNVLLFNLRSATFTDAVNKGVLIEKDNLGTTRIQNTINIKDDTLDTINEGKDSKEYLLKAVIYRSGDIDITKGGHYVAIGLRDNGYYLFNDYKYYKMNTEDITLKLKSTDFIASYAFYEQILI